MISINQLTISFGDFDLFKDVSFLINERDRIGLVGKNGAGKTTLLKAVCKLHAIDKGQINIPKDLRIGYLPQQMKLSDTTTVIEETKKAFKDLNTIEKQIEDINNQIVDRTDYESDSYHKLIDKLTELNQQFEILGGANKEGNTEQTLLGLGFTRKDFERQTKEFSGGWRMRIEIAKLLLQKPEALLLDEPTNHLDIESIQWLEDFLKTYPGAVILVSHDRRFLDTVTNRTIEISLGNIYDYKVSYSSYVELRKERREQQIAAFKNQQKQIQDTERFIERFRYKNTKAVQVQSRVKQLEKLDRIEVEDEDSSSIRFKFPPAPHSGNLVIETKNLTKNFGDLTVFQDIDLIIEKGDKISFVGKNGEGKTTMSRIFMNELDYTGHFKLGHNVKIGYYAQNQTDLLNEKKTVFETIDDIAVGDVRTKTRDILGSFLFSGEDIEKKVSILSGGEKSRLALACMLLEPVNLLILDAKI
jgi:ATP-binding cassette, subfamily F, member 3